MDKLWALCLYLSNPSIPHNFRIAKQTSIQFYVCFTLCVTKHFVRNNYQSFLMRETIDSITADNSKEVPCS